MIKKILYPLRKFFTKFILFNEKISEYAIKDINLSPHPIEIAANYVCSDDIRGDYLEFGVFKGWSFIKAYHALKYYSNSWNNFERTKQAYSNIEEAQKAYKKIKKIQRKFFAFDSFKGLPEIIDMDLNHPRFSKGRYDCSKENFLAELVKNNVDLKDIEIVEGFYKDSLTDSIKEKFNLRKASIIMIDCDLYDSTKDVLKFISNLIQNGTIIIFDDWYTFKANPSRGQQRACSEWLEKNPKIKLINYKEFGPYQKSFIVNIVNQ